MACRYAEDRNHTPLSLAAEAGNHDIVTYLLGIINVSPEGIGKKEVCECMCTCILQDCVLVDPDGLLYAELDVYHAWRIHDIVGCACI